MIRIKARSLPTLRTWGGKGADHAGLQCGPSRPPPQAHGSEVLLVHPGGPWWRGRDLAAWAVPKGLPEAGETLEAAAQREFREETGLEPPSPGPALTPVRDSAGKIVHCWLAEDDLDLGGFRSAPFELEWPPRSGRRILAPEADAARYFGEAEALERILPGQRAILLEAFLRLAMPGGLPGARKGRRRSGG